MNCPQCQHVAAPGAKFCHECGHKFQQACPQCQEVITVPNSKFCFSCGFKLASAEPGTASASNQAPVVPPVAEAKRAERRQLTVAFCDLVGSTALSDNMDVEEFRQVILDYQKIVEDIIVDYGANVGNYLGDGLLVYFGYPVGLEDAPRIAVKCCLAILRIISQKNIERQRLGKPLINVRIGIHTGMVIVDDHLALGDTTNIAARIEGLADTNTVVISSKTNGLTEGWFVTESKGLHTLKGITTPMEIFQVKGASEIRNKFEISYHKGLSPIIGRDAEMDILLSRLNDAKNNNGQVVLIEGDAGIGKSRLIEELRLNYKEESNTKVVNFYCSSYYQNSPYFPIKDFFERKYLNYTPDTTTDEKFDKLKSFLSKIEINQDEHFGNLIELLEIDITIDPPAEESTSKIEDTLSEIFMETSKTAPLVIIAEDIQWADPSLVNWLEHFVTQVAGHGILLVISSRDKIQPVLSGKTENTTHLKLTNLSGGEIERICRYLANNKVIPQKVLKQIIERTDGIPLYVEELTRIILQSSSLIEDDDEYRLVGSVEELMIPSSLRDSLMARLDQLNVYKSIIQLGSVIGREFDFNIIEKAVKVNQHRLGEDLDKLVELGFLFSKGSDTNKSYVFKSAMIQEIAYESLLNSHKKQLHHTVANVIEQDFNDQVSPEILAYHFKEAGVYDKAIVLWEKASASANKLGAFKEGLSHISKALESQSLLPESDEKAGMELRLQLQYCAALRVIKGWTHTEVQQAYDICLKLTKNVGDSLELFQTLFGIWTSYLIDGNFDRALEVAHDMFGIAERLDSKEMLHYGSMAISNVNFYRGDPHTGDDYLWRYTEHYDVNKRDFYIQNFGLEPMIFHGAIALWFPALLCDYPEYIKRVETTNATEDEFNSPFSSTVLVTSEAICCAMMDDPINGLIKANRVLEVSNDLGYSFYPAWGMNIKGWALARVGDIEEGLKEVIRGKEKLKSDGCNTLTLAALLVAKVYLMKGDYKSAMDELDDALYYVSKNHERVHEPEIWRIKGLVLLNSVSDAELIKEAFQKSLDIADELNIPLWRYKTLNTMYEVASDGMPDKARIRQEIKEHMERWPKAEGSLDYKIALKNVSEG